MPDVIDSSFTLDFRFKIVQRKQLLPIFWYSMIPIAFLGFLSGYIFYENDFEKPALWIAAYAAAIKSLWGIFGATVVIGAALNTGC